MPDIEARFLIEWPGFTIDVDLTLPGRGITALFGHSGSGKTSILRCIAGLERAATGRLVVDGEVWQDQNRWLPTHKRPLGYVFQEASLFPHLTVRQNLNYGVRRSKQAGGISLDHAIALLGIDHLLEKKPDTLSGGERQRVGMARALAVSPKLLLMDEPLAALDLKRKQEILPYLERLHAELAMPIIYVSHAPEEVTRLADYLVALDQGHVQAAGPLAEVLAGIDLPIRLDEEVSVIIPARVGAIDTTWHLARLEFSGGGLWIRNESLTLGQNKRLRIMARDVSLLTEPAIANSSIQNVLAATVDKIGKDNHPGMALVRVRVGDTPVIASITLRALNALGIHVGQALWVQVKTAALLN